MSKGNKKNSPKNSPPKPKCQPAKWQKGEIAYLKSHKAFTSEEYRLLIQSKK